MGNSTACDGPITTRKANRSGWLFGNELQMIDCSTRYSQHHRTTRTTTREGDVTSALASHPPLTAADRCDRCGAQAYIRVTLVSGGELLFCAHHGRAHEAKLREVSTSYQDETEMLAATPHTASDTER
jgi:hypothetical protein